MRTNKLVGVAISMFLVTSCNQQSVNDDKSKDQDKNGTNEEGNIIVEESAPSDSTGTAVAVALDIQSSSGAGLWLDSQQDEEGMNQEDVASQLESSADSSLKISDSVTLSMARFNLWAIKVKADREQTAKEKNLETKEREEDADEIAELEADLGNELTGKDAPEDKMPEMKPTKVQDKIKEKREHYKKVSDERKERDIKRDKSNKFHGPYIYDAIAGKIEGEAPVVDLNDGSYRRIEFKMKRNVTAEDADPIFGNVFVIKGNLSKGEEAEAVPFEISWHSAMNFRLKGDGAYKVETEGETKLSIVFDLEKWFDGVDLMAAKVSEDGVIYINKNSNKDIMKMLRKNIKVNTRFGNDKDGNGKIDASETAGQGEDTPETDE